MPLPRLVYFASRGRAEIIRLVLAEAGVAYEDETFKGAEAFGALKASGRLAFMAVPIWEEEGLRLAQSAAIATHLARTHGLYGKNPKEQALIDQAFHGVEDARAEIRKLPSAEPGKRAEVRAELIKTGLPRWFGYLEKLLAANHGGKGFLVGDSVSVADFALYYLLEMSIDNGFGAALADCPLLTAFKERIAARPKIAAYLASPRRFAFQPLPT